jgi:hypothetical protein
VPGIGPGLGAILASGLYGFFKFFHYETVNGSQDRDGTAMNESPTRSVIDDTQSQSPMAGSAPEALPEPATQSAPLIV